MQVRNAVPLAPLTTLRVGGPADHLLEAETSDDVIEAVRTSGAGGCLILGGGSNLLVPDAGVRQTVIAVRTSGVRVTRDDQEVVLTAAAGEHWDTLVQQCVSEGWGGVEALSGIPGSVGATPIQNVGAYGQEVSTAVTGVEVFDCARAQVRSLTPEDCRFAYRSSVFRDCPGRYVVLSVELRLPRRAVESPVHYAELAGSLGVAVGQVAPIPAIREAVLALRRSKGMVLDPADHDTWSAGSFFTNPVLDPRQVPLEAPSWPHADGRAKTSAAWLIEHAGFPRGFGAEVGTGRARLSTKHALAITNRGQATAADVLLLARTVRNGVLARFGITLHAEPTLVATVL